MKEFESMKFAYFNYDGEKEFEVQVDKLESINEKYIIKDVIPMNVYDTDIFSNLSEEILVLQPYHDGEDFYLQYINHSDYYQSGDNNFRIGSLISQTLCRNDENGDLMNTLKNIYKTGEKKEGILKFLSDEGKLLKYLHYRYFKRGDAVIGITTDRTEVRMYRDSILNNEKLGVAIIQNNKIVELNETYARSIHKTKEELLNSQHEFKGMDPKTVNLLKKELKAITRQEKLSYKSPIIKYDDNGELLFYLNIEATYITYNNLPAVLVKVLDLTKQERYKQFMENNTDSEKRLESTFDDFISNAKVFHSFGIYPDEFHVSENFYKVIEDETRSIIFDRNTFKNLTLNEDLKFFDAKIDSITPNNTEVDFITRIMTLNFNIKYIQNHVEIIFDSHRNPKYLLASHYDVTKEMEYTNELKKEIYTKNEMIKNKEIEIKEAHHNIKNNINILLSLIRMEEHFKHNPTTILNDAKSQLQTISLMHEKLYQSPTVKDINLKEYIDSIVESLLELYLSEIKYISYVDNMSLNAKQATTLGIIINEFVNNTVKYAFPDGNPGTIELKISRTDKDIELEYHDSGVGLPEDVKSDNPKTMGMIVIQNLTKQLNGTIKYHNDNGLTINLEFTEEEEF